jgi:hypothetical protein
VAHALTTDFRQRDFDAALLADDAAVLQALVLAAQAFVVLDRTKDFCAKQAITFRLEGTVVDGFRLLDFAVGPGTNLVGGRQTNLDRVELFILLNLLE